MCAIVLSSVTMMKKFNNPINTKSNIMDIKFEKIVGQEDTIIIGETPEYVQMGIPFGEDHECYMDLTFMDGFAFDKEHKQYTMIYPTIEDIKANTGKAMEIVRYTGRDTITPYDIALKYGEVIKRCNSQISF